jgi:hypothetical protein
VIGLIITGLIETDGSLTTVGLDGSTNEIVARRFLDIVGGGATVDCSK